MSLTKAAISLIGASSLLLAAPAFAADGVASRLSIAGSSAAAPASPNVGKGRSFISGTGLIFVLIGVTAVAVATAVALDDDDDNGSPASP